MTQHELPACVRCGVQPSTDMQGWEWVVVDTEISDGAVHLQVQLFCPKHKDEAIVEQDEKTKK